MSAYNRRLVAMLAPISALIGVIALAWGQGTSTSILIGVVALLSAAGLGVWLVIDAGAEDTDR